MITKDFIDDNRSGTFAESELVVMHTCMEAKTHRGKVWKCRTDSYKQHGQDLVFLDGFAGSFDCKYLALVNYDFKPECLAFANWLSNQDYAGRTIEKLWSDYMAQFSPQEPKP